MSDDSKSSFKQSFKVASCKTESVVVYLDRAEVKRSLKIKIRAGENEIILNELSQYINKDTVRVDGHGEATISEVAFTTKYVAPASEDAKKTKEEKLVAELEALQLKLQVLQTKRTRLIKQRQVLDGFADKLTAARPVGDKSADVLNKDLLQGIGGFLDLFDERAVSLDGAVQELDNEYKSVSEEMTAVHRNLDELRYVPRMEENEILVLLEAEKDVEVELMVSYVVTNARWSPKYDIRVFGNDKQMKLSYYGIIEQNTGEDWQDTKLFLSTATPSVGGTVPELGTIRLKFKEKIVNAPRYKLMRFSAAPAVAGAPPPQMDYAAPQMMAMASDVAPEMVTLHTEVHESIATAMYEIARRATVPSDNVSHKVSVALVDFEPVFEYESVPKKAPHVFLKARVKNASHYALLAGPANIYLDNSYIAKSSLAAVCPGEEFSCSLGVDPSVKINYKPLNKYKEHSGLLSKVHVTTYRQVIEVKNTRQTSCKMLVTDQLPLSTLDKIKVTLLEPAINLKEKDKVDVKKPVRVNSTTNNVEWEFELAGTETKELVLKYTVEHPASEEVETTITDSAE